MTNDKIQMTNESKIYNNKCQNKKFHHLIFVLWIYFGFCALSFGFIPTVYAATLDLAKMHFLQDDYPSAIQDCQGIVQTGLKNTDTAEAYYLMGLSYLKINEPAKAASSFQDGLSQNPDEELKEKIDLAVGETYFLDNQIQPAYEQFKKILSSNPKTSFAPTLYFHLANCGLKLGLWDDARSYLNKINQEYPLSLEAPFATDILKNGEFYFTIQIGSFINEKNARELYENLKSKGYDAYLSQFERGGSVYHRVRVGKFNLPNEVLAEEEKLKNDGFPTHLWP